MEEILSKKMTTIFQETGHISRYKQTTSYFDRQSSLYNNDGVILTVKNNDSKILCQPALAHLENSNTIDGLTDEYEDARPKKRKSLDDNSFKKQVKVSENIEYSKTVEEQNDINTTITNTVTCSEEEKIEFALVPENKHFKDSKELVLNKACQVPQENSSSPTLSSKSLQSEIHQSRQCLQAKLEQSVAWHKDDVLKDDEVNYSGHVYHAYHCPKLQHKDCFLPFCKDPREITDLVDSSLATKYVKGGNAKADPKVEVFYKICINHALNCKNRAECDMPLCKDLDSSLKKLIPDELSRDDSFEVLHNTVERDGAKYYQHGVDFNILHEVTIGKGAYGRVTNCWYEDKNKNNYSLAMKKSSIADQGLCRALAHSLPILKKLENLPNVLVPQLILQSSDTILMFSDKADISLFEYMQMIEQKEIHGKGLPVDTCTAMIFDMAKGVNQLHSFDFTHGDIKPSNCVLTDGFRNVKLIDLDSVKPEDKIQVSGTLLYAAPEVKDKRMTQRTVRKPSDVYSLCRCIPVLLFGTEKILELDSETISRLICEKDRQLAEIYEVGTQIDPTKRLTAKQLVRWFRKNALLKQRWSNYQPERIEKSCFPGEKLNTQHVLKSYLLAVMDDLPKHF